MSKLDGVTMLTRLAELLRKHPPHANDYPILFRWPKPELLDGSWTLPPVQRTNRPFS